MNKRKFQGKYRIKTIRLKDYDYSKNGAYFITICTENNEHILGSINNQLPNVTRQGEIVKECWLALPLYYCNCILDEFIVMPNHVHGIVIINNDIVETCLNPNKYIVETGLKPVSATWTKTKEFY